MENLTKISNNGLVIFAGAGCSMAPPSSLPNWNKLNEAILNTLWDKLEPYGLNNRFREQILTSIIQKRDDNKFPPDYQAQRMEERAGIKYFQLLSAVDSDTFNAIQYYAAIMAKEGLLKAIVTTNFDRNFERAFDAKQVDYTSYYDEDGFNDLTYNKTNKIPIIKIHGCCSSPSSMVDTKKQRLKGRAVSLQNTLSKLLTENYFIFSGFSGQDLDDNSNYLGLREAAPSAIGFTYLNLPGNIVKSGMQDLINNYGESKTSVVTCNPADYFEQLLSSYKIPFESFHPEAKTPQLSIEDRLKTKVASLTPMDAVNMLTALAESYGDEISARFIYDKVWKERDRLDYNDESFSRFLLNQGR